MGLGQGRRLGQAPADAILAVAGSAAELLRERQEGNCCAPVALQHPAGMLPPAQVCPHPARAADAAGSPRRGILGASLGEQGLCTTLPLPLLLCCVPAWLRVQPRDSPMDFLSPCSTWGVTPCLGGWHVPTHMHLGFTAGEVWGIWGNLGVFLVLLSPVQRYAGGGGSKAPSRALRDALVPGGFVQGDLPVTLRYLRDVAGPAVSLATVMASRAPRAEFPCIPRCHQPLPGQPSIRSRVGGAGSTRHSHPKAGRGARGEEQGVRAVPRLCPGCGCGGCGWP